MELNLHKCVLVPLFVFVMEVIRKRLAEEIPGAANFIVAKVARYLGVWLEPNAKRLSWEGTLKKYVRAAMVLKTKHPPLMGLAKNLQF